MRQCNACLGVQCTLVEQIIIHALWEVILHKVVSNELFIFAWGREIIIDKLSIYKSTLPQAEPFRVI